MERVPSPRRINENPVTAVNIGYDMGILSQHIFTMLVIMAFVTTIMTGPLVTHFGKTPEMAGA